MCCKIRKFVLFFSHGLAAWPEAIEVESPTRSTRDRPTESPSPGRGTQTSDEVLSANPRALRLSAVALLLFLLAGVGVYFYVITPHPSSAPPNSAQALLDRADILSLGQPMDRC